jgi:hypothetical protein
MATCWPHTSGVAFVAAALLRWPDGARVALAPSRSDAVGAVDAAGQPWKIRAAEGRHSQRSWTLAGEAAHPVAPPRQRRLDPLDAYSAVRPDSPLPTGHRARRTGAEEVTPLPLRRGRCNRRTMPRCTHAACEYSFRVRCHHPGTPAAWHARAAADLEHGLLAVWCCQRSAPMKPGWATDTVDAVTLSMRCRRCRPQGKER